MAFVIAQAASFLVLNSALPKMSTRDGMMLASMTAYTDKQQQQKHTSGLWYEVCEKVAKVGLDFNKVDTYLY